MLILELLRTQAATPNAEDPDCLVEHAVDARMATALGDAKALLYNRFGAIRVADLAKDFEQSLEKPDAGKRHEKPEG